MNESKTEKQRYWLALMLDDLAVGTVFDPRELHITIMPWFVSKESEGEITSSFQVLFTGEKSFEVIIGPTLMFGPERDIAVNVIESEGNLMRLHEKSLKWFERMSGKWAVKTPHVGGDYVPHVRRRSGKSFAEGQAININSISLIKAGRTEDDKRTVSAKVELI